LQCSIPSTTEFNKITQTFRTRNELVGSVSVARVRPRTSKGITAVAQKPPRYPVSPGIGGKISILGVLLSSNYNSTLERQILKLSKKLSYIGIMGLTFPMHAIIVIVIEILGLKALNVEKINHTHKPKIDATGLNPDFHGLNPQN
jgi:hypothetical protein